MRQGERKILARLQQKLAQADKPANQINCQQFHKETLKDPIGLKAPVLRTISKECYKDIKSWAAGNILTLCDNLLASGERYMRFFAFEWALKVEKHYTRAQFELFEGWLERYVDGWGSCDHLCCGPIGHLILKYPELSVKANNWTKSKNRWLRRASAVCLIVPVRKGLLLDEVRLTADLLLIDSDDLVQKGYGWMLKEASHEFPDEVFRYVLDHKDVMPRTALRYAIEKLPADKRKQAMKRD